MTMMQWTSKHITLGMLLLATLGATAYVAYQDWQAQETMSADLLADGTVSADQSQDEGTSHTAEPNQPLALAEDEYLVSTTERLAQVLTSEVDIFAPPVVEVEKAPKPKPKKRIRKRKPKAQQVVQASPPEPEKPQAPPLPFKFMGKLWGEDGYQVFVTHEDVNLILKQGDFIASLYKVEAIKPPQMTLIYLPLSEQQTLDIGM